MKLTVFDYKELYNQSLEKARDYHDDPNCLESLKDILEDIFPSLKESEDEKIRKALVRYHLSTINIDGIKGEEILAWLEKQGGQKPKWSDEDEELLQLCCGAVAAADYYTLEDKEEMENWLKSIKKRMEEQQ
jgi:hypothetical protein